MTDASQITGIAPFVVLLSPVICFLLEKINCDGCMTSLFQSWMLTFYAILGFCPDFNIIVIALADGLGIGILTVLLWQVIVDLCPSSYIGTLGGLMYLVRNTVTALTFVVSGYILQSDKTAAVEVRLDSYNNLFLMLVIMSSIGVISGVFMNLLDTSKTLNSRIARWRQSNIETMGLISMTERSSQYCGTDGVDNTALSDD